MSVVYGAGDAAVARSTASISRSSAGESVALLGPLRLGEDDAAPRPRRARRADRGRSVAGQPLSTLDAAAAGRARDRLRLPGREPAAALHRVRERRLRGRARRTERRRRSSRPELLELVGLAAKADHLPVGAVRRRGAARRARARARAAARAAALRRADRPPRLRHRRARARPDRRAAGRARLRARRRDARRRRRRPARPRASSCTTGASSRGGRGMTTLALAVAVRSSPPVRRPRVLVLAAAVGAARRDAALRRPLAADDDRRAPSAACRSTGRGRSPRTRGAVSGRRGGRAAAGRRSRRRRWRRRRSRASRTRRRPATIRAGAGAILAVPPGYLAHLKTFRFLHGALRPGEIVLDQQLAATLQARTGDTVALHAAAQAPGRCALRSAGSLLVTAPDVLFQPLNPLVGPAPAQPPANIAILPIDTFAQRFAPLLPSVAPTNPRLVGDSRRPARNPVAGPGAGRPGGSSAEARPRALQAGDADPQPRRAVVPGPGAVRRQPRRQPDGSRGRRALCRDALHHARRPGRARRARRSPTSPRSAPSSATAATWGSCARAALRGATCSKLTIAESAAIGLVAGALGTGAALLAVRYLVGNRGAVGADARARRRSRSASALAFAGAAAARIGAGLAAFRGSVIEARRGIRHAGKPLWQRLYLDVIALAVSGLVYWLTARTGFSAVVNPDSNPTLSLSVYMFLAPALLWIGATLLLVRARGRAVAWIARRAAGTRATSPAGFLLASAGRRGAAINRGLVVIGASARLRRQPRDLHRDLQPADPRRRRAHARSRRRGHGAVRARSHSTTSRSGSSR